MKLANNLVLIRVDPPIEQDENGVFIQEEWQTQEPTGIVEAVGMAVSFCKVGDKVFFERYTAIQTPMDKDLRLCREDAIFAILDA